MPGPSHTVGQKSPNRVSALTAVLTEAWQAGAGTEQGVTQFSANARAVFMRALHIRDQLYRVSETLPQLLKSESFHPSIQPVLLAGFFTEPCPLLVPSQLC